jgi:hypothetical protein
MRKLLAVLALVIFIAAMGFMVETKHYNAFAPELFGNAQMHIIKAGDFKAGVIYNNDTAFIFYGQGSSGSLIPINGATIYDRSCPECGEYPALSIPFSIHEHGNQFSGNIFFRGHARKFCSADLAQRGCFRQ